MGISKFNAPTCINVKPLCGGGGGGGGRAQGSWGTEV